MKIEKSAALIKIVVLVLVVSLMTPCYVSAAVIEPMQPNASDYLDSYNAYVCAMGGGKLEIWFSVTGDNVMDEIGTLSIRLYESTDQVNWTRVKTFLHEDWPSMLEEGDYFYSSYVPYQGVAGRYYKAYVGVWAGKNGAGDSRYFWTSVERAT
jgi:hypothetical protein